MSSTTLPTPAPAAKPKSITGFSLVELSIVLVIIGLLAGGVLVGRDLIKGAEIRGFLSTLNKFNVAASSFRLRYKNLPGDLWASRAAEYGFTTRAGTPGQGDGNGIIDGCATGAQVLGCETALFWRDLTDAELTSTSLKTATDIPVDGTVAGFNVADYLPLAPFRDSLYYFVYPSSSRNLYYISRISAVSNAGVITPAAGLTPFEARAIDEKLDDGAPGNGIVRPMSNLTTFDPGAAPAVGVCVDNTVTPNTYNSGPDYADSVTCQLSIRNAL